MPSTNNLNKTTLERKTAMTHEPKQCHIVLQGKGGCGKSFISILLSQVLSAANGHVVLGIDTDPVNQTLNSFKGIHTRALNLMDPHTNAIESRKFDEMMDWIVEHDGDVVIDNGASSFVPVTGYIAESGALSFLEMNGIQSVIHVPVVGGLAQDDTIIGLISIIKNTDAHVVVWKNHHLSGEVELDARLDSALSAAEKKRIVAMIDMPKLNPQTFGEDLRKMMAAKMTFGEALAETSDFGRMEKFRLKKAWDDFYLLCQPILR